MNCEQNAFDILKNALFSKNTKKLIFLIAIFADSSFLQTDSSDYGLRVVISQEFDDGEESTIFILRKLSKAELNYSTIEKECLAIRDLKS